MAVPGFWDDPEKAQDVVGKLKALKAVIEPTVAATRHAEALRELYDLANDEEDTAALGEIGEEAEQLRDEIDRLELMALLSGPNDNRDCYFSIQAGTGGADACDWAEMMLRMYLRHFERCEYSVEELSRRDGEEAGIQSTTLLVRGPYAFGNLSCEIGVHRLVRISPFSAQGKRETSFSSVDVQPVIDDVQIEVDWDKDVREDTYRASGAGGQHVNKTSSAIRLTHEPTGVVVQCQNERSQHKNRATARKMLMAKLYQMEQAKRDAVLAKAYAEKGAIGWGNKIRNYFLHPEQRVKDDRTGLTTGDTQGVLDGDLQPFIDAELRRRAAARAAAEAKAS